MINKSVALAAMQGFAAMAEVERKTEMKALQELNGERISAAQQAFEAMFGADQNRTPAQWRNLVSKYGMGAVCEKEGMDWQKVNQRMHESFRDHLKRTLKEKKRHV
ncbi:hypothetical protein F0L74_09830 [Chitinophaga agrisoli]|uniref:Uncharacterized protein n=1 Tax=Chitinophaga agrisoli TaxID=2607653 RepID=A0A5B2VW41_9BACT|nr:hypothetical protein [Chitinophaga agrisoli]KAA2242818.1 hypothetical protein F0L74_09830 [Chitinophaga agrisoli]